MNAKTDLEAWLEIQAEKVVRNAEVVTAEELSQDAVYHISINPRIPKFIPIVGRRQAASEDRTVPRITCAPTLLGCIMGYSKSVMDFHNLLPNGAKAEEGYRGGFYIYDFPLTAALKPNNKLVYDASATGEVWLVPFNEAHREYKAEVVGKFFLRTISYSSRAGKLPESEMTIFAEIKKPTGLPFSQRHVLTPGYWVISGPTENHVRTWKDDKDFRIESIDKSHYDSVKKASADLLGFAEAPQPGYTGW